ncbi:hypothetical protein [Duncaniella muris]|uniref:hypothetical protein n=1 Tax=Duncaniella muris TaxID=2094150 RepID=UPI002674961E|nr:hypothetical protein [Duncaniella muris]
MKHKFFYSFLAGVALMFSSTACTPEDESLPAPDLTAADLVEGKAYTIEIDQATNKVKMKSLLGSRYVTSWIHPQGIERKTSTEANIPFAGDYEIRFGVMTRGGIVYGEPYRFTLENTNGDLLTDPLWTYLTGGADQSKTWELDTKNLDLGAFTFMCAPMGWDKFTDGKTYTEADYPSYAEDGVDDPNWVWQAGAPDWLFGDAATTTATIESIHELTFDLINGANLTVNGQTKAFVMDPDRKTITMPAGLNWLGDRIGDSYFVDMVNIELVKLNEHVLGLKLIRNDGKGGNKDQRMVLCFVEKGWDGEWPVTGPSLSTVPPVLPEYKDLATDLFTIIGDDASYHATAVTYLLDSEQPYCLMEWDGTVKNGEGKVEGAWKKLSELYGTPACPAFSDDEFVMTMNRYTGYKEDSDGKFSIPYNAYGLAIEERLAQTEFTIEGNKIVFAREVTLLATTPDPVKGKEFTVFECNPENGTLVIGVPVAKDENGVANRYVCANLTVKPLGGGQAGPTVIAVNPEYLNCYIQDGHHYRLEVYNAFYDADGLYPVDVTKLRLKKGQTIKLAFRLPGITWTDGADPKVVFGHNFDDLAAFNWDSNDAGVFSNPSVSLNKDGVTEISLTNTTSGTLKFEGTSCFSICIQQKGLVVSPLDADGNLDATVVKPEIVSLTIE